MPGANIPPVVWGVLHDKHGLVHVVPTIENELMLDHELLVICKCGPEVRKYPNKVVVIHQITH
jgi:hypothetical protein